MMSVQVKSKLNEAMLVYRKKIFVIKTRFSLSPMQLNVE